MKAEISPSSRAYCVGCHRKMEKLEIRVNILGLKYCQKCFTTLIEGTARDLKKFEAINLEERQGYLNKLKIIEKLR